MAQERFRYYNLGRWMVIGAALLIVLLTVLSFTPARNPDPEKITYGGATAVDGWRTAQDYNCMDCHTVVGNGAYYAPDLTPIVRWRGQAWVRSFLDNPSRYPTAAEVAAYLPKGTSLEDYLSRYPRARIMVEEWGGKATLMPFLTFDRREKEGLTAWLSYLSDLNTNKWPPSAENRYSFAASFEENLGRFPESSGAWAVWWLLVVFFAFLILYAFFHWLRDEKEER